jgi:Tfp pilus assembly ATPase PilU
MQTMDMALADLFRHHLVSQEDAIARAIHPDELRKLIHA